MGPPLALTASNLLVPVPAVDPTHVVLTDASYSSWAAMFAAHEGELDYLLTPGDYTSWGICSVLNRPGGTACRPRTIRYYNPGVDDDVHPVVRSLEDPVGRSHEARIGTVQFSGMSTTNWMLRGVTVSVPEKNNAITQACGGVTWDYCLIENCRGHSLRIRQAHNITIQRCVIRNAHNKHCNLGNGDSSGIQVGGVSAHVSGICLLDNEIYNCGDCIQLTGGSGLYNSTAEVLIEGNDLYFDGAYYIANTNETWQENSLDIKTGSLASNPTVVRNNRMWGARRNAQPTARGELLVINNYARNMLIDNNIFGDAPRGIKDESWPTGQGIPTTESRNIVVSNNQFHDIRDLAVRDIGAVWTPVTDIAYENNNVARCEYLCNVGPPSYPSGSPTFTGNVLVQVATFLRQADQVPPVPFVPGSNTVMTTSTDFESYERRRWTGPELATGAIPATG